MMNKRIWLPALLSALLLTGCAQGGDAAEQTAPPAGAQTEITPLGSEEETAAAAEADTQKTAPSETAASAAETTETASAETTGAESSARSAKPGETVKKGETTASGSASTTASTDDAETTDTETTKTTEPPLADWQAGYQTFLTRRLNKAQEDVPVYFALICLDDDEIPELALLEEVFMELYKWNGSEPELLLEDGYKDDAVNGQNVCFRERQGLFASAFSTMGAGSGFIIYEYEQLDAVHVSRYYFDNNEDEEGEMPYNDLWDRAEEFGISDNGYHDVTLDDTWTHIGTEFADLWVLNEMTIDSCIRDYEAPEGENITGET